MKKGLSLLFIYFLIFFSVSGEVYKIGCIEDDFPFCYENEDDTPCGYIVDLVNFTKNNFLFDKNANDISFEYVFYSSCQELTESLLKDEVDLIFPAYISSELFDSELPESKAMILSDSVYSVDMSYVCRDASDFIGDKIAVPYKSLCPSYMENYFPASNIVLYDDLKSCLDAVRDEKCGGAIFNSYKVNTYFHKCARYRTLQIINLPDSCQVGFAASAENKALIDVLNEGIKAIPNETKTQSISQHILINSKYTFKEFLRDYAHIIITIFIIILLLVLFLIISLDKLVLYMNYDSLTRLLNRRTLDGYMQDAKKRADDKNEPFCILMLDLDDFKKVNDAYGHACGDEVLKVVAKAIMHSVSNNDYIFRWGGEEILVLVRADKEIAVKVAERIRHSVEQLTIHYKENDIKITSTIGVASYKTQSDIKALFEEADQNMYKGKKSGKNVVIAG